VAILTTGDELRRPGEPLGPGQIYDSNAVGLGALVAEAGGNPVLLGPVRDDLRALSAALREAEDADVLVTAAGISVGDRDFVADALSERGILWKFRGVRMKPGKPASFGLLGERPVFGLPGNPAAALVAFEVLARPALLRMQGYEVVSRPRDVARLDGEVHKRGGTLYFVRGVARREGPALWFRPLDRQGAGMVTSMIGHNALALLPPEATRLALGDEVEVWLLGEPLASERARPIPVVAFIGPSGAGKTALLERLLPVLRTRGLRVAALKRDVHGFEMDRPGKDTWRLAHAGAASVAIAGPDRVGAILGEPASDLAVLVGRLFPGVDLVLAEGFHEARCPKILVLDARGPEPRDLEVLEDVRAVVGGDVPGVRSVASDDIEGLAAIVLGDR
jgi:molybdopterin-guanine dinucleotide biosynthesis protein MobB